MRCRCRCCHCRLQAQAYAQAGGGKAGPGRVGGEGRAGGGHGHKGWGWRHGSVGACGPAACAGGEPARYAGLGPFPGGAGAQAALPSLQSLTQSPMFSRPAGTDSPPGLPPDLFGTQVLCNPPIDYRGGCGQTTGRLGAVDPPWLCRGVCLQPAAARCFTWHRGGLGITANKGPHQRFQVAYNLIYSLGQHSYDGGHSNTFRAAAAKLLTAGQKNYPPDWTSATRARPLQTPHPAACQNNAQTPKRANSRLPPVPPHFLRRRGGVGARGAGGARGGGGPRSRGREGNAHGTSSWARMLAPDRFCRRHRESAKRRAGAQVSVQALQTSSNPPSNILKPPSGRQVVTALRLVDVSINHQATGWLRKGDVKAALSGFFRGLGKRVDRLDEVGRRIGGGAVGLPWDVGERAGAVGLPWGVGGPLDGAGWVVPTCISLRCGECAFRGLACVGAGREAKRPRAKEGAHTDGRPAASPPCLTPTPTLGLNPKPQTIPKINEALDTDEPGDIVAYPRLFEDDEQMNQARGGGGRGSAALGFAGPPRVCLLLPKRCPGGPGGRAAGLCLAACAGRPVPRTHCSVS